MIIVYIFRFMFISFSVTLKITKNSYNYLLKYKVFLGSNIINSLYLYSQQFQGNVPINYFRKLCPTHTRKIRQNLIHLFSLMYGNLVMKLQHIKDVLLFLQYILFENFVALQHISVITFIQQKFFIFPWYIFRRYLFTLKILAVPCVDL